MCIFLAMVFTDKGNDIQRFYRYGLLVNPQLKIYKPWLDQAFVTAFGGRTEMSEYLIKRGACDKSSTEKAYEPTLTFGRNARSQRSERLDRGMKIVEPIMGIAPVATSRCHRNRRNHGALRNRLASGAARQNLRSPA